MSADGVEKTRPTRDRVDDGAEGTEGGMSVDGPDLHDLLDGLMDLHWHQRVGRWREVSDEGLDAFVERVVDVLLPKATRMLRGDGWVLTREADDVR